MERKTQEIILGAVMWTAIIFTIAIFFATMGIIGIIIGVVLIMAGLCHLFLIHATHKSYKQHLPTDIMTEYGKEIKSPLQQQAIIGSITILAGLAGILYVVVIML
jgi:multisubunit Na+/H+ antiporter MnhC subunit